MPAELIKAPKGTSADEAYTEAVRLQRQKDTIRAKERSNGRKMAAVGVRVGSAVGATGLSAALFAKFPASEKIAGKVPTAPIVSGAFILGALATNGMISNGLEGAGLGVGLPYLDKTIRDLIA